MIDYLLPLFFFVAMIIVPIATVVLAYIIYTKVSTLTKKIDAVMQKLIDMQ